MKHSIIVLLIIAAFAAFVYTGAVPGIWLILGAYFGLIAIAVNRRLKRRGLAQKQRFYWI